MNTVCMEAFPVTLADSDMNIQAQFEWIKHLFKMKNNPILGKSSLHDKQSTSKAR